MEPNESQYSLATSANFCSGHLGALSGGTSGDLWGNDIPGRNLCHRVVMPFDHQFQSIVEYA
jgi:hypothetical protein